MENKLSATQHNMEQHMLNISYENRKTNKWVRDQTKVMDIMEMTKNKNNGHGEAASAAERIVDEVQH